MGAFQFRRVMFTAALLAAVVALSHVLGSDRPVESALVTDGYVQDNECVGCHFRAAQGFRQSPMSRSFFKPSAETIFEPFKDISFYHAPSDRHYTVDARGSSYVITRYQQDPDGTRYNELSQNVKYVIGGGAHSRTYLYQNAAGELYQMPLAWHAELDGWWMHGGYDRAEHSGFRRSIQRECIGCHTAYPPIPESADRFGHPHAFPEQMPDGIGCQRCHGPGAEHVKRARNADSRLDHITTAIVNPAHLDRRRAQDVCLQCHLQPGSNISSRNIRFGRGNFEYRPGDVLTDTVFYATFGDEKMQTERFEANHHPYRLNLSACADASGEALTCTTCHDPHHRPAPPDRAAHYRAACLTCHGETACEMPALDRSELPTHFRDADIDDCVACHMPRRRAHDLVHEVVTDHRIVRRPPAGDLLAPRQEQPPYAGPASAYPHMHAPAPEEMDLHLALIDLKNGIDVARFAELLAADADEQSLPSEILMYGGALQKNRRQYDEAVALLERAVAQDPEAPLLRTELAMALLYARQPGNAAKHVQKALGLSPTLPEAHFVRGVLEDQRRQPAAAIRALAEAVRLRPQYVQAWNHKATLHLTRREFDKAIEALQSSLRWEPRQPNTLLQCGLAFTVADRHDEALRWFRRGRRMAPELARFAEGEAMAMALGGSDREGVEAVLEQVRSLPDHDEAACLLVAAILDVQEDHRSGAEQNFASARLEMDTKPSSSTVRQILYDRARQMLGFAPGQGRP